MEQDPLIGRQLGAYLIQAMLGEGGMAHVYKAYHARLRRDVAIKVILSQMAQDPEFRARFEREAQLIASLEHHNIVAVYDFGEADNLTYLVMQYVGGGTLRDQLREGQALEPRRAAHYALQMANALHHAHLRGIVHRDVKPQNMLVSASDPDLLLLSDFGIAKLFESNPPVHRQNIPSSSTPADPSLTSVDQIIGTAEYMAPEQISQQPIDARTDVYALGVVLYQMLTGRVPFQSTTVVGLMYQHVHTPPRPVREINPNVPEVLAQITARALAKAPEARFPSADAMAQALERAITPPTSQYPINQHVTYGRLPGELSPPLSQERTVPTYVSTPPSPYGQPPTAINGPMLPTTTGGNVSIQTPSRQHYTNRYRVQTFVFFALIILALALLVGKVLPLFAITTPTSPSSSFTENFQNNNRHWFLSSNGGLTEFIQNNQYILTVNDPNTHFAYPAPEGTANGPLPTNFTLTADIERSSGDTQRLYGLVFRFQQDNSGVHCYAFVVNGQGDYGVLKYDPDATGSYSPLKQGTFSNIGAKTNTLQVTAQGNKFSFKINGKVVPVNNPDNTLTDRDHPYTGGQLGLMVTGPNIILAVTKVQLAVL